MRVTTVAEVLADWFSETDNEMIRVRGDHDNLWTPTPQMYFGHPTQSDYVYRPFCSDHQIALLSSGNPDDAAYIFNVQFQNGEPTEASITYPSNKPVLYRDYTDNVILTLDQYSNGDDVSADIEELLASEDFQDASLDTEEKILALFGGYCDIFNDLPDHIDWYKVDDGEEFDESGYLVESE